MKYNSILFDMDGVILDSEPLHLLAFQKSLQEVGFSLSKEEYIDHFAGMTDSDGFERYFKFIGKNFDLNEMMKIKTELYLELAKDNLVAYPKIVELILELNKTRSLALVTGSTRTETEVSLKTLGIIECFKTTITADDVENGKPNPEGYLKALNKLDSEHLQTVVIEDSPKGITAAKAAGLDCIAVTNTHDRNELNQATMIVEELQLSDL